MNTSGYFKLHRKIVSGSLFSGPRDLLALWIWILSQAFFQEGLGLKVGQFVTSRHEMLGVLNTGKNSVSKKSLQRYIKRLIDDGRMCLEDVQSYVQGEILVTVLNYSEYQEGVNPVKSTQKGLTGEKLTVTPIIKKNKKNISTTHRIPDEIFEATKSGQVPYQYRHYAEGKKMDPRQVAKQFFKWGHHHKSKGTRYLNWYMAWQTWVRNDLDWKSPGTSNIPGTPGYDPGLEQAQAQKKIQEDNNKKYGIK